MRAIQSIRFLLAAMLLFALNDCGGGGGGGSSTPAPTPSPSISSFTAATSSIPNGTSTTLTAVFSNGTGSIDQGIGGVQSGVAVTTGNLTATRTYTLTVSGSGSPATAQTTVTVQPPTISVSITPNGATLLPSGTQQFTATVANSANQSVNWTVQEGAAGGIVSASGLYTAPSTTGTFHVIATSQADTSRNASVAVTVSAPFTLSVTPITIEQGGPGTTRIQINRFAGFTGAVTLSGTGVPAGLSGFFETTTTTGNGVETSFVASNTLATGLYNISITGAALGYIDNRTLPVSVVSTQGDFKLILFSPISGDSSDWLTSITVPSGSSRQIVFGAIPQKLSTFTPSVALTVDPPGAGITAALSNPSTLVNIENILTITVAPGTGAGMYPLRIKGVAGGLTRWVDTTLIVASSPIFIKSIPRVSMATNSSQFEIPMDLGRAGQWFLPASGAPDAPYWGSTGVLVNTNPAGIASGIDTTYGPLSLFASEPFQALKLSTLSIGNQTFSLVARRVYSGGPFDTPFTLNIRFTDPASSPDLWIHNAEWAQTVISRDLRLVEGKTAFLLVQVMADRIGITSPTVQATFKNGGATLGVVALSGPATVPNAIKPGEFTKMYKTSVQANWVTPGLTVDLSVDPSNSLTEIDKTNNTRTLTPPIGTGRVLDLKLVPIIHRGFSPRMPNPADVRNAMTDYWPLRDVQVSQRAAFVTDIQIPSAGDPNLLVALLNQITLLRAFDHSASHYYGLFNNTDAYGGNGGVSQPGFPVAIGVDLQTSYPGARLPFLIATLVHEFGHGFNLRHAPNGGAVGPNLEYPYIAANIGTWGYSNRTDLLFDPSLTFDIMSYAEPTWTSDFNYGLVQAFFESIKDRDLTPTIIQGQSGQMVIIGSISPSGEVSLSPVHRIPTEPMAPKGTGFSFELTSESGTSSVNFEPQQIQCLPEGWRSFMFTLPVQGELQKVRVLQGTSEVFIREATRPIQALATIAKETTSIKEKGQALKIRWDQRNSPYLTVIHEGEENTALTVNHSQGSVDLPVDALPKGGRFRVILSDGLNSVERILER